MVVTIALPQNLHFNDFKTSWFCLNCFRFVRHMPALLYGTKFFVLLDLFGDFNTCVFIVILHYSAKSSFGSFVHLEAPQLKYVYYSNAK